MKAIVYNKPGDGKLTDIPYPVCGDNQIIIKIEACGICKGAELGHATTGTGLAKYPVVPGHEFAGTVHEIGKNVTKFKVGDRVTADNTVLCGECYYCMRDQPLYCDHFGSLGHNINGGFAEYVLVDKEKVFAIPDSMSFNEAAIIESVSCCIHAVDMIHPACGENILILGTGSNGIILAQLLKASGALSVTAMGSKDAKLKLLNEYGIDTIKMDRNDYSVHEAEIKKRFPHGLDAIVDTTASPELVSKCFKLLKKGGRMVQYGVFAKGAHMDIDCFDLFLRELQYYGTCSQTHCFGRTIDYVNAGIVKLDKLVTHEFPLSDYFKAIDITANDRDAMKIIIHP